ncbi:hypothetical protein [Clostridium butyricum]|uniref:hypothetical protein n=1 Tax=Clostridium butyricum TaxID=1492 RepID=UPI00325B6C66
MEEKYLLLTTRHESVFGNTFALFWGDRENEGGYTSDLRVAHRFTKERVEKLADEDDIAIPISILNIPEECETNDKINKNINVLVEKGTLNKLIDNLNLKHDYFEDDLKCPKCDTLLYDYHIVDWDDGRPIYKCPECDAEINEYGEEIEEE